MKLLTTSFWKYVQIYHAEHLQHVSIVVKTRGCCLCYFQAFQARSVFLYFAVKIDIYAGLHKLCYPTIRDRSTWSKFGAHGEHGDVFLFSNLGAL